MPRAFNNLSGTWQGLAIVGCTYNQKNDDVKERIDLRESFGLQN